MTVISFDPYKNTVCLKYFNIISGESKNLKEVKKFVQIHRASKCGASRILQTRWLLNLLVHNGIIYNKHSSAIVFLIHLKTLWDRYYAMPVLSIKYIWWAFHKYLLVDFWSRLGGRGERERKKERFLMQELIFEPVKCLHAF